MKTAIVVMDLGDEKWIKDYYNEYEANNYFVQYLNQRLIDLKKEKLKIKDKILSKSKVESEQLDLFK